MSAVFHRGADISFVDEVESEGGAYFEEGERSDVLDILKRSGINAVRLRLWHDPNRGYCGLERTKRMAGRARDAGLRLMLDIHYSDSWADPGKQIKPRAWKDLAFPDLVDAVRGYTATVVGELRGQDTLPEIVQIGNEITPGMLWDNGRVGGEAFDTARQWRAFADLAQAGLHGMAEGAAGRPVRSMIHIDRGGDNPGSRRFLDRFSELGVRFDLVGLSYYPWWHGTLQQLTENLRDLAVRYGKDIMVVETAYPWRLPQPGAGREGGGDGAGIISTADRLHAGYAASVEGQAAFLRDLVAIVRATPRGHGCGLYYWEPCWIPSKESWSVGHANNWSHLTLFDTSGNKLPSLDALGETT